jgi:hypothetical protein
LGIDVDFGKGETVWDGVLGRELLEEGCDGFARRTPA